jgi:hypothetical protein
MCGDLCALRTGKRGEEKRVYAGEEEEEFFRIRQSGVGYTVHQQTHVERAQIALSCSQFSASSNRRLQMIHRHARGLQRAL